MVSRFYVCQGQKVTLFFDLTFSHVPKEDPLLEIKIDTHLTLPITTYKLTQGKYHNITKRKISVDFSLPETIKKTDLTNFGEFNIYEQKQQIFHDELPDVEILDKEDYFEKVIVPLDLHKMAFNVQTIGGQSEPDIISYHKHVNSSELFDVECTIESPYNPKKWAYDNLKFERYKDKRTFSKLLIVCTNNITAQVLDDLNRGRKPAVGLITYEDLYNLRKDFEIYGDYNKVFSTLSKTGKISFGGHSTEFNWLHPKLFKIPRNIP